MPSPIAHIAVGVTIGLLAKHLKESSSSELSRERETGFAVLWTPYLMLAIIGSVLPDLDSLVGVLAGDFGKYHNNLGHSLSFGLCISLVVALFLKPFIKVPITFIFSIIFCAYFAHILMDAASITRGVMLIWPISEQRYASSIPLFYGVRWSEGLFSYHHLITVLSELVFAATLIIALNFYLKSTKRV